MCVPEEKKERAGESKNKCGVVVMEEVGRRCDENGREDELKVGSSLFSGVTWPFAVTMIYGEQKCYNITAANHRKKQQGRSK